MKKFEKIIINVLTLLIVAVIGTGIFFYFDTNAQLATHGRELKKLTTESDTNKAQPLRLKYIEKELEATKNSLTALGEKVDHEIEIRQQNHTELMRILLEIKQIR